MHRHVTIDRQDSFAVAVVSQRWQACSPVPLESIPDIAGLNFKNWGAEGRKCS